MTLGSQFRQVVRSLTQKPAFAIPAVLTIALGIGVNAAVYAVVHAILLEPLPFHEPKNLVQVWETHPELHNIQVSVPDYLDWKRSFKTLDLAAYTFQAMDKATLVGQGEPIAIQATNACSCLFPLLGIEPFLGRAYDSTDEREKRHVILISEQLWHRKFSADPRVIGRSLHLDSALFTIVGVLPRKDSFPLWADVWMPLSLIEPELYSARRYHPLEVIGRLRPGASLVRAEIETEKIALRLSAAFPATNGKIGATAVPLMEAIVGDVRPALMSVWVAAALVLLITCANLAHLMMSRALSRRQEIALRLALGASRLAAFQGFLLEGSVLSLIGGPIGILAAALALPALRHLAQAQLPRLAGVQISIAVLLFGVLVTIAVGFVFALPSYVQVFRSDLRGAISSINIRSSARHSWTSAVIMGSEIALSVAVLVAAIVLVRSFSTILQTPLGFQPGHVFAGHSPLADGDWQKSYQLFRNDVAPALQRIPGIEEVAAVNSLPMSLGITEHSRYATRFAIAGRQVEPGRFPTAQIRWCTSNYFHVVGIPLMRGRLLTDADHDKPRYLVNESFARRFFPGSNPVGQKISMGVLTSHPELAEIVGVVGDIREFGLTSSPEPTIYSLDISPGMEIVIKTARTDAALRNSISATLRQISPELAIGSVRPLSGYISASLARQRFVLTLITTFASLAIWLCGIGVYGVFSYSVAHRMREFGIRSALGALSRDLLRQVFKECVFFAVPGLVGGIAISVAFSSVMRSLLYRVSPTDGLSLALAVAWVLALSLGSVAIPALRAAAVDPATVLREG